MGEQRGEPRDREKDVNARPKLGLWRGQRDLCVGVQMVCNQHTSAR